MAEDAAPQAPAAAPPQGDQAQTAEIPSSMFGGKPPQEGEVVEFKVISVDQQSGNVTVAYNTTDSKSEDMGGSDGMADEFSKEKMSQKGMM